MTGYQVLRDKYFPAKTKIVFILESPPAGHGYVYDSSGHTGEVLFRSFMKLIGFKPDTKERGLQELQKLGVVLTNPIYEPVNKLPEKEADIKIIENYDTFVRELTRLTSQKLVPVILVKSNICRLLEGPLVSDGFTVLNDGVMVPFPMHFHEKAFLLKVRELLNRNGISLL